MGLGGKGKGRMRRCFRDKQQARMGNVFFFFFFFFFFGLYELFGWFRWYVNEEW